MGTDDGTRPSSTKRQLWLRLGAFAVVLIATVSLLSVLPVRDYLETTTTWVDDHLLLGTLGFILVFWIAVPLCLPSTALEMVAGSLFGVPHAVFVITVGKTGGSTLAFLLGRSMGKEMIGGYLRTKFPTFRAFSEVLNSPSWKPVLLYQLSSIPNVVKIYSLAITHVSVARFAVSSAVGNVPHAVLWAYIGEQATDIAAILTGETKMTTSRMVMVVTGVSLTVLAITFLVVYTKRQLQELQKRECRSSSEEGLLLSIEIDASTPASVKSAKSTTQCVRPSTPAHQVWT
ncbi:TVP38/TMEM64 family membrane protein [Phytophthora citrophthora]|uniref:TVP38/TMEM64 family membrane protein n=1 Tax=Phytophthora citrophthora TaxID=4793 RepID=A0AAD9LMX8_9STRA|nr:TVP38/TMEM64 family membrane protein [Phytophthora citrophthora]